LFNSDSKVSNGWPEINSLPQEEIQQDQMVEFSPEQEQLFQRRFEEKYDLSDPVYQQWLKIYHPTVAEQMQEKQIQNEPIAYSAQKMVEFSLEQEQLFQNTFEHPHFMQLFKTKLSREHEEMNNE